MGTLSFFLALLLADFAVFTAAQSFLCEDNGVNHTSNSFYDANLGTLLSTISENLDDYGFYNASLGKNPDRANAIVLCRGDIQLAACRRCVDGVVPELRKSCRNLKQGVIWYDDCMLRYSNESIFGIWASNSVLIGYSDILNVSNQDSFNVALKAQLADLRVEAAFGGLSRKVAAGNRSAANSEGVFAMMQCTPDLSPGDCQRCLTGNVEFLMFGKRGGRVFSASCDVRYGISKFYNETRLQELQPRPPPPPSPPPPSRSPPPPPTSSSSGHKEGHSKMQTVIIIPVILVCWFTLRIYPVELF